MEPEKGKPAAPALPAPGDEEAYLPRIFHIPSTFFQFVKTAVPI